MNNITGIEYNFHDTNVQQSRYLERWFIKVESTTSSRTNLCM